MSDRYSQRGVSSQKEDVHNAIAGLSKGEFENAFCKIVPDYLTGSKDHCIVMHADGAGTKSSLAYLYYRETGDLTVFDGIAQDSMVMNIDDLLCVGAYDNFMASSTIGRNSKFIPGEVIKRIIESNEKFCDFLRDNGINITMTGGETADVGDLVRTIIVDTTVISRMKRDNVVGNDRIRPGHVILGLSSFGQTNYEDQYNSGMGSNGLTSARHDIFNNIYAEKYPETYSPDIPSNLVYSGPYKVTDRIDGLPLDIGKAVLSPTRTYAPVIKNIIKQMGSSIGGIVHCSGGAQTKCLKFGNRLHYIKDNLFEVPPLFNIIKDVSGTSYREMFSVFNMGHRMELYIPEECVDDAKSICDEFNLATKIVGRIEESNGNNKLTLKYANVVEEYGV